MFKNLGIGTRLGVGFGGDDVHAHHRVGLLQLLRGFETLPIELQRRQQQFGREVRGEGVGQT